MAKGLFANQKKIQRVLRKQKEYKLADGTVIDLIQQTGTKEHVNRYVTSLMDLLYKPEEIYSMETKDLPKDERYMLLK
ncbi:unnamed protein product, partial [Rotaria sp. Silwood1]